MERIKIPFYKVLPILIALGLFLVPFFWFGNGKMDIGGDSSRLYFFDPLSYLSNHTLFSVSPSGLGNATASFWGFPYIFTLFIAKLIINSPSLLIKAEHGVTLALSFYFVYLCTRELLKGAGSKRIWLSHYVSITSGLFYILSPRLIIGWDKVIMTHTQIVVNPLIFFFFLRYIKTSKFRYILISLLISFIYAQNFSYAGAPPFFAFFPAAIFFIFIYNYFVLKKRINLFHLLLGGVLFVCLHAFHLVPQILYIMTGSNDANSALFSEEGKFVRGLSYFVGVAGSVRLSTTFMGLPQLFEITNPLWTAFIAVPIILVLGIFRSFELNEPAKKTLLVTASFFLVTTFLVTATIVNSGFALYKLMFYIPGFSMFRNYFGQWQYLFIFFFAIVLGLCLYSIFYVSKKKIIILLLLLDVFLVASAWDFINGSLVNKVLWKSKNIKIATEIDSNYKKLLTKVSQINTDGKMLTLPLADPGYQTIADSSGGAYQGPSSISYIAGKNDFVGYDDLGEFKDDFLTKVQSKDFYGVERILSVLDVDSIFYNSDKGIYDDSFTDFPYTNVRKFLPSTQAEYKKFLKNLSLTKEFEVGPNYNVFKRTSQILPHFFVSSGSVYSNEPHKALVLYDMNDIRTTYINSDDYKNSNEQLVLIPKDETQLLKLKDNYHLHVHSPYAPQQPNNPVYPFVLLRETQLQDSLKSKPDAYLDMSFLHMAKRGAELEQWADQIPVLRNKWRKPVGFHKFLSKSFDSWESILTRYEDQTARVLKYINSTGTQSWREKSIIKLNEQIVKQEPKIKRIIRNSSKTFEEKKYLYPLVQETFKRIKSTYKTPIYNASLHNYVLENNPEERDYIVRLNNIDVKNSKSISIKNGNSVLYPAKVLVDKNSVVFPNLHLKKGKNIFEVTYETSNLGEGAIWKSSGVVSGNLESNTLQINNPTSNTAGITTTISEWKPNTQYVITFDYKTFGKDFSYSLYERKNEKSNITTNNFFEKRLNSLEWKTEQTIINSDPEGIGAFINIISDEQIDSSNISIKNFDVREVNNPQLVLESINNKQSNFDGPSIYFSKINPTKYEVIVSGANKPYILGFLESFNPYWRVYFKNEYKPKTVTGTYFEGKITEGNHRNLFIYPQMFETATLNQIAQDRHIRIDGYANGWEITPHDTENKKNYTLIVEMKSQQVFYVSFIVSLATFIIIFSLLLYSYAWKR